MTMDYDTLLNQRQIILGCMVIHQQKSHSIMWSEQLIKPPSVTLSNNVAYYFFSNFENIEKA